MRIVSGTWYSTLALSAVALCGVPESAFGQAIEREYVTPIAGTSTQRFGYALAVDGEFMVGGAPYEDSNYVNSGCAFVFRWDPVAADWIETQQLFPSDPEADARFGVTVAISGDAIAVGAALEDNANGTNAGAVYVFRLDAFTGVWSEEQKIIENGGFSGNEFGTSVDLDGTALLIGASKCDMSAGLNAGCAFVYRWVNSWLNWVEEAMLVDPNSRAGDRAGYAVAIEGNLALVASPLANQAGVANAGSVAVWRESGSLWWHDQTLSASQKSTGDQFGISLAVRNGLVIVGVPFEDGSATLVDSGAACLFRHDGTSYAEEVRFAHPTPGPGQQFGRDVDVDDNLVVVGSMTDDAFGSDAGCAFTFRRGRRRWAFDQPFAASDAAADDHLGVQVALNDLQVLVAADGNNTVAGTDRGVVYGYLARELTAEITPSAPAPDAPVTMTGLYGTPGTPVLLVLVDLDGTSMFVPLLTDVFGVDHLWTVTDTAPNPPLGMHVGLMLFKISATGPLVASDTAYVDL